MSVQTASLAPEPDADALPPDLAAVDARAQPTDADEPGSASLKTKALHGSAWTTFDYFAGKALSLVSNVLLTRMVLPHEKGLTDICIVILTGLQMFSDIGIGPNIIFSKRGDDPQFLNTAWTLQVIRGVALFLCSCVLAWPMAMIYEEPRLLYILPICGFTSCIMGFQSTSLVLLNRQMRLGLITILDLMAQVLSVVAMLAWAYWVSRTVWAVLVGWYVAAIFRMIYSHLLAREHRSWFAWNKRDVRSMIHFGRWIFISTILTFFAMNLDRLLFAKLLGIAANAVYTNAVMFSTMPQQLIKKIGAQVAFPVLAIVARERPHELSAQFRRVRYPQVFASLAIVIGLMVLAKPLVNLLYRGEYQAAGPMLQILAVGAMGGLINLTYGSVLMAMKKTFDIMLLVSTHIVFLLVASFLGYRLHPDPEMGFIWGVSMVEWLNYPVYAAVAARHGLWHWKLDVCVIVICAVVTVLVFVVL